MLDLPVAIAGLFVGFVVGLTGMGGGALMTPLLVLLFGVEPLAAVSSDVVASLLIRPIGGAVHWSRGTVHKKLALWLILGSVPAAFLGVVLLRMVPSDAIEGFIQGALGVALVVVSVGLVLRPLLQRDHQVQRHGETIEVRRLPTLLIGALGGLVVGATSVGSGSLMMILLLLLYPRMRLSHLVGTDLIQAVPLIASAALGHLLFGNFQMGLTASILVGSIPGVYLGARFSSRAPDYVIRPALIVVLGASGLKLLGVETWLVGLVGLVASLAGLVHARQRAAAARAAALGAVGTD